MEDDNYIDYSQPSLVQKREPNSEKNVETEIIRSVLKNRFFEEMSKYGFNFDLISSIPRLSWLASVLSVVSSSCKLLAMTFASAL